MAPTLDAERALLAAGARRVAGIDEVGRGALAGPVSVGVVVIDAGVVTVPDGLTDSKLLTPARREALAPVVQEWALDLAVGHASAEEIDEHGIITALRIAALRALANLRAAPDAVILDGSHDWLTRRDDLFADVVPTPPVHMRVKADLACASVAAASVVAKVERDGIMRDLDLAVPGYGFADHKGYASPEHMDVLRRNGATAHHRRSWKLPTA